LAVGDASMPGGDGGSGDRVFSFDFRDDLQGWVAGFSDYPFGMETFYELASGHRPLPAPLDTSRGGFYLGGNNHSDDLFMYLRVALTGLPAHQSFDVRFAFTVASNAADGCIGVGGAPGEGVTMKAGATAVEPTPAAINHTVDKGNQGQGGYDAIVVGNIAVPDGDCGGAPYQLKSFDSGSGQLAATSGDDGKLWVFLGTDSGFEGKTELYYTSATVTLHAK
jgi:hypothetical protein